MRVVGGGRLGRFFSWAGRPLNVVLPRFADEVRVGFQDLFVSCFSSHLEYSINMTYVKTNLHERKSNFGNLRRHPAIQAMEWILAGLQPAIRSDTTKPQQARPKGKG